MHDDSGLYLSLHLTFAFDEMRVRLFRSPVLPQVGTSDRSRRHSRRPKGLSQVRHQRNRQRRQRQGAAEEREGRRRHRGVSLIKDAYT